MSWFFAIFFGAVALCAAVYLGSLLQDRLAPGSECEAVVKKRYTERFPLTMGFVKRDRAERHLVFEPEGGEPVDLTVSEDLYKLCPVGTRGNLSFQGKRLVRFDVTALPEEII